MNFVPEELIKDIHYSAWGGIILSFKKDVPKPHLAIQEYTQHWQVFPLFVIIVDNHIDVKDEFEIFFRLCANIDPKRDILFSDSQSTVICDATSKNSMDDFTREWPDDLYFSEEVYKKVDNIMENHSELQQYKGRVKGCHFIDKDGNYEVEQ